MLIVAAAAAAFGMSVVGGLVQGGLYLAFDMVNIQVAESGLLVFFRSCQFAGALLAGQLVDAGDGFRRNHCFYPLGLFPIMYQY